MSLTLLTSTASRFSNWFYCLRFWLKLRQKRSAICLPFEGSGQTLLDRRQLRIGSEVRIGARAHLSIVNGGELAIGDGTSIGTDLVVGCSNRIRIGSKVLIAARCFISDTYHEYEDISVPIIDQPVAEGRPVTLEDECWIGINVSIMPGVTIGRHSVVGANSVVTRDVPPYSVVCGAPAKVVRRYDPATEQWAPVNKSSRIALGTEVVNR